MSDSSNNKVGVHTEFYKPYHIKPAEVYVEPNTKVCQEEEEQQG